MFTERPRSLLPLTPPSHSSYSVVNRKIDDAEALIQGADDAYQRGNRLFQKGNKERAKHHYMKAVTLFPKHVYAWSNLGTVLRELGELQGSVEAHKQVRGIKKKSRGSLVSPLAGFCLSV